LPLIEAKLPDYPQWRKKVTQETKTKSMGCKNGEIPILKKEQEREGEKKDKIKVRRRVPNACDEEWQGIRADERRSTPCKPSEKKKTR